MGPGGRFACRLSALNPHRPGLLAVPAGVVVGDFLAEGFQLGDQFAEAALVVEPGLVVRELVVGQDPGDGLAVYLAGPLVVGAVQAGRGGSAWQR
jgi:hypothetical protein